MHNVMTESHWEQWRVSLFPVWQIDTVLLSAITLVNSAPAALHKVHIHTWKCHDKVMTVLSCFQFIQFMINHIKNFPVMKIPVEVDKLCENLFKFHLCQLKHQSA